MAQDLKLNQSIALLKTAKSTGEGALTRAYQSLQKAPLLAGVSKTYQPRLEDGETLPSEGTKLQLRVPEILAGAVGPLSRLIDLTATVDTGNQTAKADVVVDDVVVLEGVPVSTLLFLEKKLASFAEVIAKVPTLDPSEDWTWDENSLAYRTAPSVKARTKKVLRNHVKAEATDKHPAQVETYGEDVIVGDWSTTLFSGAVSEADRRELASKVAKLQAAVKIAREQANMTVVPDVKFGRQIFEYLGW